MCSCISSQISENVHLCVCVTERERNVVFTVTSVNADSCHSPQGRGQTGSELHVGGLNHQQRSQKQHPHTYKHSICAVTEKDSGQLPTDPLSNKKNKIVSQVFNKLYTKSEQDDTPISLQSTKSVTADLQCFV